MKQLRRYFDTVAGWMDELYHHARGHTLVYVRTNNGREFDGWALVVYKDYLENLCVDDLDGITHEFKFPDIRFFMIGD